MSWATHLLDTLEIAVLRMLLTEHQVLRAPYPPSSLDGLRGSTSRIIFFEGRQMFLLTIIRVECFCKGLPRWLSGKEPPCQCRRHRRRGFDPWIGKMPWRRKWQSTPVFLPGESHGQRSLAGP